METLEKLKVLAKQGNPKAQCELGILLMEKEDPAKYSEAVDWFEKAANLGEKKQKYIWDFYIVRERILIYSIHLKTAKN